MPLASLAKPPVSVSAAEHSAELVTKGLVRLLLGKNPNEPDPAYVFFSTLALRLKCRSADWCPTAATDGIHMVYNPDWIAKLPFEVLLGVLAHETLHCGLSHHTRRGPRDPWLWNLSADAELNPIVLATGLKLPDGCVIPGKSPFRMLPPNLTAEEYYNILLKEQQQRSDMAASPGNDPGGCGGVVDAGGLGLEGDRQPDPASCSAATHDADWKMAVAHAHQAAKLAGNLPAGIDRLVDNLLHPTVPWTDTLRQFVNSHARNEQSWARFNRQYIHRGLYLPGMHSEELGHIGLLLDASGSIGQDELNQFAAEAQAIFEAYDCTVHIAWFDTDVYPEPEPWTRSSGPLKLNPRGGGGTVPVAAFQWLAAQSTEIACCVVLTDMEIFEFPPEPEFPTLWAVVGDNQSDPPFGSRIDVKL